MDGLPHRGVKVRATVAPCDDGSPIRLGADLRSAPRRVGQHALDRTPDRRLVAGVTFGEPSRLDQHGDDRGADIDRHRRQAIAQPAAVAPLPGRSRAEMFGVRTLSRAPPRGVQVKP
jgi:hypothetical protein